MICHHKLTEEKDGKNECTDGNDSHQDMKDGKDPGKDNLPFLLFLISGVSRLVAVANTQQPKQRDSGTL